MHVHVVAITFAILQLKKNENVCTEYNYCNKSVSFFLSLRTIQCFKKTSEKRTTSLKGKN